MMDPMGEEQLDYGDGDYAGKSKFHHSGGGAAAVAGAIHALAEDEMIGDDDEYDDLYNDVNVGEHFLQQNSSGLHQNPNPSVPNPNLSPNPPTVPNGNNGSLPLVQPPSMKNETMADSGVPGTAASEQNPNFGNKTNFNSSRVPGYSQENNRVGDSGFQGGSMTAIPTNAPSAPIPRPAVGTVGPVDMNGPTTLVVSDLHWWTTDSDLESVASQFGKVKEIKFFEERASGKSKGYCQIEFYDPAAAAACKEGMNGYEFNGRPCAVTFASPQALRQMGASYANKNQGQGQAQPPPQQLQDRRQMNDGMGRGGGGGGVSDGGRNFGRGGWGGGGRGGQGMMGRGQGGGIRGRGFAGGKGIMGAGGGAMGNNGPFAEGLGGPVGFGGPAGMMNPQNMMGAGFDPTFLGRGGPYGGFPGSAFAGMMPPFQAVNSVGLPGVAPHVNPAFFGRGMAPNGMGLMGNNGMEGQMWGNAGVGGGWIGEEQGRAGESSYGGDDGASDYGYGEVNHERGGRSNTSREKDRGSERDWSGNSDRRRRDDKEHDRDRSDRERHREEKDGYRDYRSRDRDHDNEPEWDRGQSSSRSRSKSYMPEDDYRSRSRDADYGRDYGKRRRE